MRSQRQRIASAKWGSTEPFHRERQRAIGKLAGTVLRETPWVAIVVCVSAIFAFRAGTPGFRHDWIWPADARDAVRWFVDNAISEWNPHGLGNAGQIPTFNLVLGPLALLGSSGISTQWMLFVALAVVFIASYAGLICAVEAYEIKLDAWATRALALSYAFSPIAFQKLTAGHLFWIAAYASLPWFAAFVRNGCRRDGDVIAPFVKAALMFAIATTQIQFVAFDAYVLLIVLATFARTRASWLGGFFVIGVGLFHNANAILAPFRTNGDFFLERAHGTLEWEFDMSALPANLSRLVGYMRYDEAALPTSLLWLFASGKMLLVGCAIVGIAVARDRRALAFAAIAGGALAFASGLNGPLRGGFEWMLLNSSYFTIFREFFHVMALYVFAVVMLAALALAPLGRWARAVVIPMAILVSLPFTANGLERLVPLVVALPIERSDVSTARLQVLLPFQEPISQPGTDSGGNDPARFVDNDASAGEPPLVVRSLLDQTLTDARRRSLLGELGIGRITWRRNRVSRLPTTFEPNVDATFAPFEMRQRRFEQRFTRSQTIQSARTTLAFEALDRSSPLEPYLADDRYPNGRQVAFDSSYAGNDIDRRWVSGRLWAWYAPQALNVLADPVFTHSREALTLAIDGAPGQTVYVLAVAHAPTMNGRDGVIVRGRPLGAYRWFRWSLDRFAPVAALRSSGFTSVARCIVSNDGDWHLASFGSRTSAPPTPIAIRQTVPWTLEAELPAGNTPQRLVYARAYSPGWHLDLEGHDVGSATRVDGIFNGWTIPPRSNAQRAVLRFEPQRRSGLIVGADVILDVVLIVFASRPRRGRRP